MVTKTSRAARRPPPRSVRYELISIEVRALKAAFLWVTGFRGRAKWPFFKQEVFDTMAIRIGDRTHPLRPYPRTARQTRSRR